MSSSKGKIGASLPHSVGVAAGSIRLWGLVRINGSDGVVRLDLV